MATSRISTIRSAAAIEHASASARVTTVGSVIGDLLSARWSGSIATRSSSDAPGLRPGGAEGSVGSDRHLGGKLRSQLEGSDGNGIATAGLDRVGEEVDLVQPRGVEAPLERVDAVLPDPDVDRLLLGGDVGTELGPAPLGEDLDPQCRSGGHLGHHRPD